MAVNPINIAIPAIPEAHHRGAEELPLPSSPMV